MHWLSVLPFAAIIPFAIVTRQVIPALLVGLLTASYVIRPSVLGGVQQAATYLVKDLGQPVNLYVIAFLYLFAGMVRLIEKTGGIKGFTAVTSRRIHTRRQTLWLIWATVVGTFSAPDLRIVTVAPLVKALQRRVPATKERLSFVIEATGLPVIVLMPAGTAFIGYMIASIALSLRTAHVAGSAYGLFVASIPYNLFALIGIALAFVYTLLGHPRVDVAAMPSPRAAGSLEVQDREVYGSAHDAVSENLPSRPENLFVPLGLAVVLTLFIPWWVGFQKTHNASTALVNGNVLPSMLVAILITVVLTAALLRIQGFPLKTLVDEFIAGGNSLMSVIVLLALVWAIASATERLGLDPFVTATLHGVPGVLVAPAVFVLGSLLAYLLGSSFGAWGILMPIGVAMAHAAHVPLPLLIGAVFGAGTFGGLVSPFSDSTVAMARIMGMDLVPYANYKLRHSLVPMALATVGYLVLAAV